MEAKEEIRSPTRQNNLRVITKGYLTEKAADFERAYEESKYQAAVYIKDSADAVNLFALKTGIFTGDDQEWYRSMFPESKEREVRARTDSEVIQDQVLERLTNLSERLKAHLTRELGYEQNKKAVEAINGFLEKTKGKAPGKRR